MTGCSEVTGRLSRLPGHGPRPRSGEARGGANSHAAIVARCAHPTTLPLLLGAGLRSFSVACARIDETRYRLVQLDAAACAGILAETLALRDADGAAALVRQRVRTVLP